MARVCHMFMFSYRTHTIHHPRASHQSVATTHTKSVDVPVRRAWTSRTSTPTMTPLPLIPICSQLLTTGLASRTSALTKQYIAHMQTNQGHRRFFSPHTCRNGIAHYPHTDFHIATWRSTCGRTPPEERSTSAQQTQQPRRSSSSRGAAAAATAEQQPQPRSSSRNRGAAAAAAAEQQPQPRRSSSRNRGAVAATAEQ